MSRNLGVPAETATMELVPHPPGRVRLLDPHTVNQIAAGEVVERPASVVKELVENALDAGARRIEVDLEDSGRTLIRVADDGCGMEPSDAEAALQRHATSKIACADDLLGVRTLGFRGEALPSIASVSRLTLSTATSDGARTVLRVEGGRRLDNGAAAGPRGTEVVVRDLFFNTPARLKFLKSDSTELAACLEVLSRLAIGYPDVAFSVTHKGQTAFRTSGSGDRLQAVADVWGRELAKSLAEVDCEVAGIRVSGFVSPPHVTRPTRAYQYLYVNGRPVKARTLMAALDQAFRDLTPERRYPVAVLDVRVEPSRVDVNVSPTKSEVKFQQEGQAFDAVRYAVRAALQEHGMMPSAADIAVVNQALAELQRPAAAFSGSGLFHQSLAAQRPLGTLEGNEALDAALTGLPAVAPEEGRYPFLHLLDDLRVLGQILNTFIVADTRRGLAIIDQHVAHERILYEHLCGLKGPTAIERQRLLAPETLELDRRSAVLLRERLEELVAVGFDIEPFGPDSFLVRAAPAALRGRDPLRTLRDLVDELVESTVARRLTPTREQIWITSACKMAVKAGDPLSVAEMEKLIVDLATTENPYLCPHGRPITIVLTREELLRKFKRA
ncbi:MAG: DNA mismatch repair endonuclease MutL [Fimbriimonadales bacterium]|nr:DNA mismatch repair endonuclease MutL [Fimbriimonadales bacterium]